MKSVFLSAAAGGGLNEPLLSTQALDRAFSPLQAQASTYRTGKGSGKIVVAWEVICSSLATYQTGGIILLQQSLGSIITTVPWNLRAGR